jgi:putative transposase
MDLFTVPTAPFRVLYCFFMIRHGRRRVPHFNVTKHPTSQWIVQQLREEFSEDVSPRYLNLDRDGNFADEVTEMITFLSSTSIRTASPSPWQRGLPNVG